ncbi:MAG TPA: hypothetical protein VKS25_07330, partial [Solirubrobacteraceae bacterium]|nr:hypothetical protein [Solirubrobacteraceae bacterium]
RELNAAVGVDHEPVLVLAPITAADPDGYRRAGCPAAHNKIRCPLQPASLPLPYSRPTIHQPPEHPPVCCTQKTITIPPSVNAKTAQKHDYPSPAHRHSYQRRTAAERANASIKDPATTNLARGHCRLTSLTPIALFTATALIARNLRTHDAYTARQADHARRPDQRRRRRRQPLHELTTPATDSPP